MSVNTTTSAVMTSGNASVSSSKSVSQTSTDEEQNFSKELASKTETNEVKDSAIKDNELTQELSDNEPDINHQQQPQQNSQDILQGQIQAAIVQNIPEILTTQEVHEETSAISKTDILSKNIQELVNTKTQIVNQTLKESVPSSIDYQTINMSDDDAMFFVNLVENTDMTMQTIVSKVQNEIQNNVQGIEQKVQISTVLMNTIQEGMKTNQPFRIDFDKDISVILKINKDGSISANFIPGDKAVEQYLKNNIGFLKQRFDDENLAYKDISYSQSKNQNRERNQQRNNKENE